ncbi:nitrogenase component 1 [Tepidimicrobium xylanilyticum]|uniref:Light-independent protochlorophyllide reductase, B subunit n=1 Tax=Tepidimicrobium xylanilyticum TaxID=1123352 RepID=A0A1H2ZHX4_9FIRM|nr:nitrogenase component 1 [Tepidimicrobium xylanilyticum]GMG96494.1 nitrogenase iron-molybdenum cofactor biosynthesis protein NifE [Tepidimicrobium xylanilyticum]SDX16991.1 light-independent protochlorophyllide reductase, B subunit [Tepidimicrobium xylanilyticum]
MELCKFFPTPSDRMGTIWTLSTIKDAYVIEFGPAGTTHFAVEGLMQLNADHNANIYTTHISETDIAFGKQDRLEKAILEIDNQYRPKYIFVMASSISSIIGTDIESICFEMQPKVNSKLIPITTGGFNGNHTLGIENTLNMLCKEIVKEPNYKKLQSYNIIGNNADTFNFLSDAEEIKRLMKNVFDCNINTIFTAYTSIDEIEKTTEGQINLVLRREGLKAATTLQKEYNMNYYYGRPYGLEGTTRWLREIEKMLGITANEDYINKKTKELRKHITSYKFMVREIKNKSVILVGDYDVVIGLANLVEELGLKVEGIIVKHKLSKEVKNLIPEKWKDIIKIDLNERRLEEYLSSTPSYLLLADGATLKLDNKSKLHLQIANPNFSKYNIYPYTPFVGYNGVLHIIQCLIELERNRIKTP